MFNFINAKNLLIVYYLSTNTKKFKFKTAQNSKNLKINGHRRFEFQLEFKSSMPIKS